MQYKSLTQLRSRSKPILTSPKRHFWSSLETEIPRSVWFGANSENSSAFERRDLLQLAKSPEARCIQMRFPWIATASVCIWLCTIGSNESSAVDLEQLLKGGRVPGLSLAIMRDGKIVESKALGVRDTSTGIPVDVNTVFEAASLSKPVFAYAVLQLVDAGQLSLDTPLSLYVPNYVKNDPRADSITVRNVLSQSSGLPNWRSSTNPLRTYFRPGERFSYSGEGFVWLQRVVEKVTNQPLNEVMTRLVFDPLEMSRSSYVWRAEYETDYAVPHDAQLMPGIKQRPSKARSASTLHTTAADYARFLQAALSGARLAPDTAKQWFDPQIGLRQHCIECLTTDAQDTDQHVAWGLGWGLEPDAGSFFHWGNNEGFKAFIVGSLMDRSAIVVFTNGDNGMAIMPEVISQLMPGDHPAFKWLDHSPSPSALLDWFRTRWHQWVY
jgi:CubicO group peptidase (beta-lactamase class C family)